MPSFLSEHQSHFEKRNIIIVLALNSMPYLFHCFCILWFGVGLDESTNHVEALWTMTQGTALNTTVFSTSKRQAQPRFVKPVKKLSRCGCWIIRFASQYQ